MRNIIISIVFLLGISSIQAQTVKEDLSEFPETMLSDMDSLYWDWQSKNLIYLDENCRMLPADTRCMEKPSVSYTAMSLPFGCTAIMGMSSSVI